MPGDAHDGRHGSRYGEPTGEFRQRGQIDVQAATAEPEIATPRFSTLLEDENGTILEPDEAFTQMFGYADEDLIGERVLDQIHPDDQARAVESWVTMLSTSWM